MVHRTGFDVLMDIISDIFLHDGARTWQAPGPLGIVTSIMRNRVLIRLLLMAAVIMGIVGGVRKAFVLIRMTTI